MQNAYSASLSNFPTAYFISVLPLDIGLSQIYYSQH